MTIDQVVTGTQSAVSEPGNVSIGKSAGSDGGEILVPGHEFPRKLSPEFGGIFNGFLVEGLVFLETVDMRRRMMVLQFRMVKLLSIRCFENNLFPSMSAL